MKPVKSKLNDTHTAIVVRAIRAMDTYGISEAHELRAMLREIQTDSYKTWKTVNETGIARRNMAPPGDYWARVTATELSKNNGRRTIALYVNLSRQSGQAPEWADVCFFPVPAKDEQNTGRAHVARRSLGIIFGSSDIPATLSPSVLVGREFAVRRGKPREGRADWLRIVSAHEGRS